MGWVTMKIGGGGKTLKNLNQKLIALGKKAARNKGQERVLGNGEATAKKPRRRGVGGNSEW